MNRLQKIAWSVVITISAGFVVSCIAVAILYVKVGMPKAVAGFALIGIAGLGGLGPLIFKKDKGKVSFDERDRQIKEKAALGGFAAAFLFAGLACMIPFFILGPKASISVTWLPNIWMGTFLTAFFVYSAAILIQYGWKGGDNE
ncbi:MAG: DUF2178 domain-containing protein [Planctomycetota bacterium]|nr:MAG: DUF2178 domain-containing protein [Planctomycetota bacterium]